MVCKRKVPTTHHLILTKLVLFPYRPVLYELTSTDLSHGVSKCNFSIYVHHTLMVYIRVKKSSASMAAGDYIRCPRRVDLQKAIEFLNKIPKNSLIEKKSFKIS